HPAQAPQRRHGGWFDRAGAQARLRVQTAAAGFANAGQQAAGSAIQAAFDASRAEGAATRLETSGPGAFAVAIRERTEREVSWIGTVDTVGLLLLLGLAYRRWSIPLLGALPLASGGLAGDRKSVV